MEVRERIEELAGRITELRETYYGGEPLVADADYDALEEVGAPAVLHAPVRHSRPMLSLEKATRPEQVAAFFDRFPGQPVIVMPKLDGLSLAVVYERGRLARAVTRGDGTTGDDVTVLVRALADGVPDRIDAGGRVEVRGEAVMLRSTFAAYMRHTEDAAAAQEVIEAIEAQRNELDYDLDGAVLRLADRNAYAAAGTRSNSPRGALAFKYAAEEKTTVLADVLWDVGKIGKVAPVAVLEPVFVGGTTVTRATLANQEVIRARDVRIGDTVLVRRAGDVIPFVAGVLDAAARTGDELEIVPPATCPSCGEPLTEQGNSRELYCTNVTCPAQTVRRLIHWASRAAADIEAIGPVWIERLSEAGLLERPSDFYALAREQLLEFDGIADVSADRMIESIDRSRPVGLRRALVGLAIPLASEGTAARLCRARFGSLEAVATAGVEALQAVEDIGPKVAASLDEHLNRESTRAELERLRALGVDLDVRAEDLPPTVVAGAPLAGMTVGVTGAIAHPRSGEKVPRPAFQRLFQRAGATTASSVSAATDLLITGADVGAAKLAKAEKLGVAVVDQGDVWRMLIDA